jgi:hypothetical protein
MTVSLMDTSPNPALVAAVRRELKVIQQPLDLLLLEALEINNPALYLDLWCRLPPTIGESIGIVLRLNCSLQLLDLSWNPSTGTGAASFARWLELVEQLLHLMLQWNGCSL